MLLDLNSGIHGHGMGIDCLMGVPMEGMDIPRALCPREKR